MITVDRKLNSHSEAPVSVASLSPRRLALCAPLLFAALAACDFHLPVDDPQNNPAIPKPVGVIQGSVSYLGPAPCFKDGSIEGMMVVLLFEYGVPPPPDGLATTALNLATIPGEKFFANAQRPAAGQPGSAGQGEYCPDPSAAPINAGADFTLSQLDADDYQIRAFYNRKGNFNPLFDYTQLASSGDVLGGAVIDPTAVPIAYQKIRVGNFVANSAGTGGSLIMPSTGFAVSGVPVVVGELAKTQRPYFYIDYAGSRSKSETLNAMGQPDQDYSNVAQSFPDSTGEGATNQWVTFPQDLVATVAQNQGPNYCNTALKNDPFACSQASFPQIHLWYGFPGSSDGTTAPADYFLSTSAKPSHPFSGPGTPFYDIDPQLQNGYPEADAFTLTRRYAENPNASLSGLGPYGPSVLQDNDLLASGFVAVMDLFPQVLLARLQDDGNGGVNPAIVPATDPAVIIQGITLVGSTSDATQPSLLGTAAGGLGGYKSGPLLTTGEQMQTDLTAIIRGAALCVDPTKSPQGILTLPTQQDADTNFTGTSRQIVDVNRIKLAQASLVSDVQFGCTPPGYYEVNVVYGDGQAWTVPNLMGNWSYDVLGNQTDESCFFPQQQLPSNELTGLFDQRPLLQSQAFFRTDTNGNKLTWPAPSNHPQYQLVYIAPSPRCMYTPPLASDMADNTIWKFKDKDGNLWVNNPANEDSDHTGAYSPAKDLNSDQILQLNMINYCLPRAQQTASTLSPTVPASAAMGM